MISKGGSCTHFQELRHSGTPETTQGQFCCHNLALKWPSEIADLAIHSNGHGNLATMDFLFLAAWSLGAPASNTLAGLGCEGPGCGWHHHSG